MAEKRRRRTGKGGLSSYATKAGERWRWRLYAPVDPEHPELGMNRLGKSGYLHMEDADEALSQAKKELKEQGTLRTDAAPTFKDYAEEWLDGLRRASSTVTGYRKKLQAHAYDELGAVPIDRITAARLSKLYRQLEHGGRKDKGHVGEPLGANTVRKVHVVIGAVLQAAMDEGLVSRNVARSKTANPPTLSEIAEEKAEIDPWNAAELTAFLAWALDNDDFYTMWFLDARTGLRRGELLALRWSDIDMKNARISVRRNVVVIKTVPQRLEVKRPKGKKARVVDIDQETVAVLKKWRLKLSEIGIDRINRDAYLFGRYTDGKVRHPENVSRRWRTAVARCERDLKKKSIETRTEQTIPHSISLHDLRHTHATLLLQAGVHPKVVQERLGHSTIAITLDIYSHVLPTVQREAVDAFSRLLQAP